MAQDLSYCDLCGLDIMGRPFIITTRDKTLRFCCDSCKGIYEMLHEQELKASRVEDDARAG